MDSMYMVVTFEIVFKNEQVDYNYGSIGHVSAITD
jgi:hypothetical protein